MGRKANEGRSDRRPQVRGGARFGPGRSCHHPVAHKKKDPIEKRSTRRTINVTAVRKIRAWQIKCRHLVETLASIKKFRECIGHDVPHNSLARIGAARNANTRSGGPGYCGIGISRSVNIECHNRASHYLWVLCVDEVGQFLN